MTRVRILTGVGLMMIAGWAVGVFPWDLTSTDAQADDVPRTARIAESLAPTAGSPDVRRLVEEIARRSRELDAREATLDARTATLDSLEQALADGIARRGGQATMETGSGAACELRGGVTKIYERMRPEQAASILDRLDDQTLRVVFATMDTGKIAAIFAEMSRERAVAFTRTLALDAPVADAAAVRDRLARR